MLLPVILSKGNFVNAEGASLGFAGDKFWGRPELSLGGFLKDAPQTPLELLAAELRSAYSRCQSVKGT